MDACSKCSKWLQKKIKKFDGGSTKVLYSAGTGFGKCSELNMETFSDFSCNRFVLSDWDHFEIIEVPGKDWENWEMGPCPDCQGKGCGPDFIQDNFNNSGPCHRCVGTGKVRYYEDGYIGEERTRQHPKEKVIPPASDPGLVLTPMPKPNVIYDQKT